MHLFHDLGIQAGNNLQQERDYYTKTADIILLLLSRHFISDNDSYDILQKAVTRFKSNEASVFQIILTPIYVECLPNIVQLPKLPKNPTSQQTRDQRFKKVAEELHKLLEDKQ